VILQLRVTAAQKRELCAGLDFFIRPDWLRRYCPLGQYSIASIRRRDRSNRRELAPVIAVDEGSDEQMFGAE